MSWNPRRAHEPSRLPAAPSPARRRLRGRLKTLSVALGLARLQLRVGLTGEAEAALAQVQTAVQGLRRRLGGRKKKPGPARRPCRQG